MGIKVITSIISLLIILFISFYTFSNSNSGSYDMLSRLSNPGDGKFSLIKDENGSFLANKIETTCDFCMERFDSIDKIFFSEKDSYTISKNETEDNIKLNKGKYFLSFALPKKYTITGTGFNISVVGPINFYVDTSEDNKLLVLSQNNIIELTLLGLNEEEKTKLFIYPHMFFTIKLNLNKILTNADYYRISQVNDIKYIKDNLFDKDLDLNTYPTLNNSFIKQTFEYLNNEIVKNRTDTNYLLSDYDVGMYDYLKKYFTVFVNDNKKIAYYKDLIYINLLDIYKNKNSNEKIYIDTISYYQELKKLGSDEYDNMVKFIYYFKTKFMSDISINTVDIEDKYDSMLKKILGTRDIGGNNVIYHVYNMYDTGNKTDFFEGIADFLDNYLGENGIEIKEDKLVGFSSSKNLAMGYYVFFIENIVKSYLSGDVDSTEIESIFNIFYKYSLISTNTYSGTTDEKKKTMLVLQLSLLKKLDSFVRNYFFEKDLDKIIFLVRKKGIDLDDNVYLLLEKGFNNIHNFYDENKNIFNDKSESDSIYMKDYEEEILKFLDYINALRNYDKYKLSKTEQDLSGSQTNTNKDYTLHDIIVYMLNFNGVYKDYLGVKATEEDSQVFNITIKLSGQKLVFDIYPKKNFLINNIYLDGKKFNGSYTLSKVSGTSIDNKDFFINTFFTGTVPTPQTNGDDTPEIIIYKKDKLLGTNGEFATLSGFLNMGTNNLNVSIVNGKVGISIIGAKASVNYNQHDYGAYINGDYYIGASEHYFNNLQLKIFEQSTVQGGYKTEDYGLPSGTYLYITGNVRLNGFKSYITGIVSYYKEIVSVYQTLSDKYGVIKMNANAAKTIIFSFKYDNKNIDISLNKDSILSIKQNGIEQTYQPFKYDKLKEKLSLFIK
ncbi:MAG: hypothetical protein PHN31_01360 [Candidatus Gracilibacteria bacterium]|nr:hypothetical protein [Candidatus Gracilibacteria bacterium]